MKTFLLLSLLSLFSLPALAQSAPPPEVGVAQLERAGLAAPIVTLAAGEVIPAEVPAAPSAGSMVGSFFSQFLTPTGIASAVVTLLGLIGGALGLSAMRKRQIAIVTQHAFHGVEDFAATTENTVDDKVAAGLRIADEWMRAQGWRPLKPEEQVVVKLGFNAINGQSKLTEKLMTQTEPAAVPPSP